MFTLVKRDIPCRLVVVSSDGTKNMEALVAALLNMRVNSDGKKANAIIALYVDVAVTRNYLKQQTNRLLFFQNTIVTSM